MVIVPDVGGITPSTWAMPCVPLAGKQMGIFVVPQIGSGVWMQFEGGRSGLSGVDRRLVGQCGRSAGARAGRRARRSEHRAADHPAERASCVSDLPGPTGGIMLKSTTGATIIVNDTGIYIQNGKGASIVMAGPTVTINAGALV